MKHKDVIFFSTLAVWVVFIFVVIVGGEDLGIERAGTVLLGGELVFAFILAAMLLACQGNFPKALPYQGRHSRDCRQVQDIEGL